jgi:calcium-dependent protein kinase
MILDPEEHIKNEEPITKTIKLTSNSKSINIKENIDKIAKTDKIENKDKDKNENNNIAYSKTTKNIEIKKNLNNLDKKVSSEKKNLIFEFDQDKEEISKENKEDIRKSIFPKDKKNNNLKLDELKINKKAVSDKPRFNRRKKKSSTVKQNQFFFNKLFSAELCVPITQEKLIWENRGFQKNKYKRGNLLGKGAFGNVYESKNPIFDNKIAMKIIDKNKININDINNDIQNEEKEDMKSEINILKKLSHPNIVRIFEFYETDNYFYLITEFCKGGELSNYINKNILSEAQLCVIFYQVFSGLIYLHENHIIHGDLKPQNILISSIENNSEFKEKYAWIKIIDFGTAKIFKKTILKGEDIVGTLYYIAPEVFSFNSDKYDEKSDIWSVGIILYKALTKKYPFIGNSDEETIHYILEGEHDQGPLINYSGELQDLIKNLLMKDPNKRPSAKEALNHPWFKKFNGRRLFSDFKKDEMTQFLNNLYNFSYSKILQLVIAFLVHNLPETESVQKILKLFRYFNESGNCELTKEELKKGLKEFKTEKDFEEKLDKIFEELDGDKNGTIEFEEFLRGCIDKNEILNDKYINYAFKFLDKEDKKSLSPEQIISAFFVEENEESKKILNNLLDSNDYDKNGRINFDEFKNLIYSIEKLKLN